MKIKKSLIPKRENRQNRKKEKVVSTNYPENIFIKNILQKNASLNELKEKIQKESNNNMHEIFSSDESRLKAIKYVLHVSKGKENQKNYANENQKYNIKENQKNNIKENQNNNVKIKKNYSFVSCEVPIPEKNINKITVKRSKNSFYNKMEQLSPIKKDKNNNRFFNDDKPLNEDDLLRDNNMLSNKKGKKYIYDSPSTLIVNDPSYIISSQREVNLQIIQQKNKYELKNNNSYNNNVYANNKTQNNYYDNRSQINEKIPSIKNNFYHKIEYVKKPNERIISPQPDYYFQKTQNNDSHRNKTIDNFYIYNPINKSDLYNYNNNNNITNETNFNKYNNYKIKNVIYSNKNNYDLGYKLNDNYNHKKNISQDFNNNIPIPNKNKNQNPFYITEVNNFYEPNINKNRINNINDSKKLSFLENGGKHKNIIRLMNKDQTFEDSSNNCYPKKREQNGPLKKKNNSFVIGDSNPMKINQLNQKDYTETEYNNLTNENNNFNNFSFHKKIFTNVNYKTTTNNTDNSIIYMDNKENINNLNNKILVKKRPLKESQNMEIINGNDKICTKNKTNYKKYNICHNTSFNLKSKHKNKIIFENENEIVEYIKNKFEEDKNSNSDKNLKYTGFVLTKKYKGKILYEIKIEDDINIINQKLKDENVQINNENIEIINTNQKEELYKLKDKIINLEKELSEIQEENGNLTKKDYLKNELIKKIDKEKQNLIKENEKISEELDKIKVLNNNLNEQLKEIIDKNKIENIVKKYEIVKLSEINYKINPIIEILDDKEIQKENIEINKTPKNNNDKLNMLSIELIDSNLDEADSKRSNLLSIFRASKVSEIKENKMNNGYSAEKEIKNSLDLLNEKSNNDNDEVNSFNENGNN